MTRLKPQVVGCFLAALPAMAAAGVPAADRAGFERIVAPLLRSHCVKCHGPEKRKADLTLHDIDPGRLAGEQLERWRLVYDQIRFGDMPPDDRKQFAPAEKAALLDWIRTELLKTQRPGVGVDEKLVLPEFGNYVDHQALFDAPAGPVIPAAPRLWRLRPDLYESIHVRAGDGTPGLSNPFSVLDGAHFKDFAAPYHIDEATTDTLIRNAETVADQQLFKKQKFREFQRLVGEQPPSEQHVREAVALQFRLALRRAPTAEEMQRFAALHRKTTQTGGHKIGARAMLMAILLQPETVFRLELGSGEPDAHGRIRLTPTEIAKALSFSLLDHFDETVFDAASKGRLATAEQVAAQAKRMLDDPQTPKPRIMQFFREYFGYPEARNVFKDPDPRTKHHAGVLISDLEHLIRHVLDRDQDVLRELLTTRKAFVNYRFDKKRETASRAERDSSYETVYGLPPDWKWTPIQPIELPADQRAGVLTHPAWLVAWSGNFENHPVQRGRWIREKLLGGAVPDVPIGVDARVPEDEHQTFRQRLEKVSGAAECWRCHRNMNPLGLVFEQYDHRGRWRKREVGQAVDATGYVDRTGVPELDFDVAGPIQLVHKLAASPHVEQVFVRHAFRFFMGRNETLGDAATLQAAHRAYRQSGGSFNAVIVSLLSSDSFLYRMPRPEDPKSASRK